MELATVKIKVYGASHTDKIGFVLEGLPAGIPIDESIIADLLKRRKPKGFWSTTRREEDNYTFLSGITNGITNGEKIECEIPHCDIQKKDYEKTKTVPRPSHVDYALFQKEGTIPTGGGRFSGRMTVLLCIAGGICLCYLKRFGIQIGAYVSRIGNVQGRSYLPDTPTMEEILSARKKEICTLAEEEKMIELLKKVSSEHDSVGGQIECCVYRFPAGKGDCLTDGLESTLAYHLFGIPAVKAVECGFGCDFASSFGSEVNDSLQYKNGVLGFQTNNNGGINGGISNGSPLLMRVTVKPTPSIGKTQLSVDLHKKENVYLTIQGRHDACIVPRAVPVVESAVAVALCDILLRGEKCTD